MLAKASAQPAMCLWQCSSLAGCTMQSGPFGRLFSKERPLDGHFIGCLEVEIFVPDERRDFFCHQPFIG
jgi:hypothetical protein